VTYDENWLPAHGFDDLIGAIQHSSATGIWLCGALLLIKLFFDFLISNQCIAVSKLVGQNSGGDTRLPENRSPKLVRVMFALYRHDPERHEVSIGRATAMRSDPWGVL
jgi:hypothetical protein